VGFEPLIPIFEMAKAFHTSDRTVTMSDALKYEIHKLRQIVEEYNFKISPKRRII
jgi:hypothetical protein